MLTSSPTSLGSHTVLLSRAQAGDRQAMNDLLLHITPFVRQVCSSIAQRHSSDAFQEAMIAIYRSIRDLREPAAFYGWVRAVASREAVRTSKRLSKGSTEGLAEAEHTADPLMRVHISDVMNRLPERHQQVLTLRALYGLSEEEAATVLAVPIGTVRSRLHRARRNFREAW
ncbi:sigma-70 family RNA polymerase sigma factor [Streptomyces sp. NPDC006512]|uniref:RNA polymerase sigma factor n=1 Tax=Streptomyces sp. NPDC006512 TaxID=3154307 RepID=UPI0033A03569